MPKKLFFLTPLILGSSLLLTGAWHSPQSSPSRPTSLFQLQTLALDPIYHGASTPTLFEIALQQISPPKLTWLQTKLWQKMNDTGSGFESEGTLQIAPGNRARLDLDLRKGDRRSHLLTICDGEVITRSIQQEGSDPVVVTERLGPDSNRLQRLQFLRERGCGGPLFILQVLRENLREARVDTGIWNNKSVIRIRGTIENDYLHPSLHTNIPARYACLYLDAKTLWPHRIEWWGLDRKQRYQSVLEIEFRDPIANQPLTSTESAQLFSQ